MVAVSPGPADEGLPVVVECLDAADGGPVFAEGEDGVTVRAERLVKPAERFVSPGLGAEEDAVEAGRPGQAIRRSQYFAEFLLDLVRAGKRVVVSEEEVEPLAVFGRALLPGPQQEPPRAAADPAPVVPARKKTSRRSSSTASPACFTTWKGS